MIVKDIIALLEEISPLTYSEGFDNTGLLVGDEDMTVTGILVTLDTLEAVVDEAIEKECNLIVSFHPIVFSGLKKLTGKTYVERTVQKAIKHDIAIFSNHTALDNAWNGVNSIICEKLGLKDRKVLVPKNDVEKVRNAIFKAGGGNIGNYENCSFNVDGIGSFKGNESSNPVVGERGITQFEEEVRLELIFGKHLQKNVLKALFEAHP